MKMSRNDVLYTWQDPISVEMSCVREGPYSWGICCGSEDIHTP